MKISKFEDLEVWKISIELASLIYEATSKEKFSKDHGLKDQIRRAAISISSNIAEGFETNNNNDFIRYLKISKGSAGEVKSQLILSSKLGYVSDKETQNIREMLDLLSLKLGKFISYLMGRKNNKEFPTR